MRKGNTLLSCLGLLIVLCVVVPLIAILNGFVFTQLWGWFVVPFGVPQIGIAHGLGLMTTVGMFLLGIVSSLGQLQSKADVISKQLASDKGVESENNFTETMTNYIIIGILLPLMMWAFGAIYHYFM